MSEFGFNRRLRIISPADYKRVFANPIKSGNSVFTILAKSNDLQQPRLGLAIAKKQLRRAVDRNRVKRQIRESFRLYKDTLPAIDIVVLAKHSTNNKTNTELADALKKHWQNLVKQCAKSSCS